MTKYITNFTWYFARLARRARTAWVYALYGWNDKDWDFYHLQKLLLLKLTRMEKHFRNSQLAEHDDQCSIELRQSIRLLQGWMDMENHTNVAGDKLRQEYAITHRYVPVKIRGRSYYQYKTVSENGSSVDEYGEKLMKLLKLQEEQNQQVRDEFFRSMRLNIEKWWN